MDLRLLFGQHLQQLVHIPLVLEVALLLLAAIVLHHKVGHGGKHALAGKAAGAHSHPLEHAADAAVGQIIAAVDVKAVEVQRLLPTPQGPIFCRTFCPPPAPDYQALPYPAVQV